MSPYYAVIDTNVLVSSLMSANKDSPVVQIQNMLYEMRFTPLYNDEILAEYDEVLHREKFGFSKIVVDTLILVIKLIGIPIDAAHLRSSDEVGDPDDVPFYEVVMSERAKGAYLVTGNLRHYPKRPFIVTPKEFLDIINK